MDKEKNKYQDFIMIKEQVLTLADKLTYEEKLKLIFSLIPWNDFHNYKYREEVARLSLGLPEKGNRKTTGEDLPNLSLKSVKKNKSKKFGKYVFNTNQKLGEWGRIDLDTTYDTKNTISDIWGDEGVILRIKIYYDENFEKLYQSKKIQKLKVKVGKVNTRDSASFTIQDLIDFGVKYETLYIDNQETIVNFPLHSEKK